MNYLIRTGFTEHHLIQAEKQSSILKILTNHLKKMWGKKECKKLLATAVIVGSWDETPGYKATFYGADEDDIIRLIYPHSSEPIIE